MLTWLEILFIWFVVAPFILGFANQFLVNYDNTNNVLYALLAIFFVLLGFPSVVYGLLTRIAMKIHNINSSTYFKN